jgi:hypothetical protein
VIHSYLDWLKSSLGVIHLNRVGLVYVGLIIFLCMSPVVQAEDITKKKTETSLMELWPTFKQKIGLLNQEYLDAAMRIHKNRFEIKLTEGRLHYLAEDYRLAAMILLELVETYKGSKQNKTYQNAIFYLADSLYHIGNLRTADKFFLEVLQYGRKFARPCALGRLLEISLLLKQVSRVQKYQSQAIQAVEQQPDPNLFYLLGKYSYQIKQYREAEKLWKQVKENTSIYPQALYYRAVALLQLNQTKKSLALFQKVSTLDIKILRSNREKFREKELLDTSKISCIFRSSQKQIQDEKGWEQVIAYAELALARIYYEDKKYDKSMDHYLAIDRNSLSFKEAIKESVWVAIRQGEFNQALQRLDVQLIDQPNMLNDPMTRILKGKLLSTVGRFNDAHSLFQELKERFELLKSRTLTPILRKARGQLISYFQKKLQKGLTILNLESLIPKDARFFTEGMLNQSPASSLFVEINALKQDLIQSKADVKKLNWVLQGPNQSEIFPNLQAGLMQSIELEYSLLQLQRELNDRGGASEKNQEYVKVRKARDRILKAVNQLPQSKLRIEEREAKVERDLMITDLRSYRLNLFLRNLEAQWVALDRYLQDHKADQVVGGLTPRERKFALKKVQKELKKNKLLQAKVHKLSEHINFSQLRIGLYDEVFLAEQKQRLSLQKILNSESEWLMAQRRFPTAMLEQLQQQHAIIKSFQKRSVRVVQQNSISLSDQVRREEERLSKYEKRLARLNRKALALGGQIVAEAFYDVLQNLNQFILEADAGLLNVFWQQKQNSSKQLGGERSRRRMHLSILKRDIVDVSK